jgi:hypothetical protein
MNQTRESEITASRSASKQIPTLNFQEAVNFLSGDSTTKQRLRRSSRISPFPKIGLPAGDQILEISDDNSSSSSDETDVKDWFELPLDRELKVTDKRKTKFGWEYQVITWLPAFQLPNAQEQIREYEAAQQVKRLAREERLSSLRSRQEP